MPLTFTPCKPPPDRTHLQLMSETPDGRVGDHGLSTTAYQDTTNGNIWFRLQVWHAVAPAEGEESWTLVVQT